jgi:hypothetical protein
MGDDSIYPTCGKCGKGKLIPVNLGKTEDKKVVYRCTNPECNHKFDEHGYSIFEVESQDWKYDGVG